jgi:hypothetical protein
MGKSEVKLVSRPFRVSGGITFEKMTSGARVDNKGREEASHRGVGVVEGREREESEPGVGSIWVFHINLARAAYAAGHWTKQRRDGKRGPAFYSRGWAAVFGGPTGARVAYHDGRTPCSRHSYSSQLHVMPLPDAHTHTRSQVLQAHARPPARRRVCSLLVVVSSRSHAPSRGCE